MRIEVLGAGCARCERVAANAREAVRDLAIDDIEVVEVHDLNEITKYGLTATPALAIDGTIVVAGRVPEKAELVSLITSALV
ncbi:MAG: thioredoxin family protein [Thermoleophilia bacterium]|jgi:small redox-active disulfide protein 2|nr:thioredoxin family protein [Thermoleophilia bacterium]